MESFKKRVTFENRKEECDRIMNKYTHRIPIIVSKCNNSKLPMIDKEKFLVPKDMNLGQFIYIIRKRIQLDSKEALFVLINNSLQPSSKLIQDIYESQKDEDGFLYIVYSSENTFG